MEVLSLFYPHLDPTNKLQPRIFGCVKCVFLGYSTTQKGYKCFHPPSKRLYVSRDVTFNEQESYFTQPHIQGENVREDEPLMLPDMTFGPEIGTRSVVVPETERRIEQVPEPVARPAAGPAPNGGKFGKNLVYSRREKAIPGSVHVQESNPPSLHEVTNSNPINSNNSIEFVSENPDAQVEQNLDLPIALRKGTRTCTQQPHYPLSNFLSFENFLLPIKPFS